MRSISVSDEVYAQLLRMKNGMSFSELIKTLISESVTKGDGKEILAFLRATEPISEESAKSILNAVAKSRKSASAREPNLTG